MSAGDSTRERRLRALLEKIPAGRMREALANQDPRVAEEMATSYLGADAFGRADIEAFFESDGPRRAHEAELKVNEAVPTSDDLVQWARGGRP